MAIWQTYFSLNNDQRQIILHDEQLKSVTELSLLFPEKTSWSKNIRQFGDLDSTCIEFIYENIELSKGICEISVRLDLRSITTEELQTICIFACKNDLLVNINDDYYDPTISELKK